MAQNTHFVNCPGCGTVLEIVSPVHDKKVISVTANIDKWFYGSSGVYDRSACTKTACRCGKKLSISWKF